MRLAFYKNSKTFFGKVIRFQQKWLKRLPWRYARSSHVELRIPYKYMKKGIECWSPDNMRFRIGDNSPYDQLAKEYDVAWSSSELDGGTRFKVIQWNTENWDFVEVEMKSLEIKRAMIFCEMENNQQYAKIAIPLAQGLGLNFVRQGYWFCSHACLTAILKGIARTPVYNFAKKFTHFWNPAQLYMWVENSFKDKNK